MFLRRPALAVPFVAERIDLRGKAGEILVCSALVVLDDSEQALSGGEQEMLAIARAMISNPKLLLLDEPSMGLAPLVIYEIFEAVKKLRESGTTILFVEQNSKVALATADRGYVIQTGEIVIQDTCANLETNPEVKKAYLGG